jgi:hypothetical protein
VNWGHLKNIFFRNWKEKLLAVILAFLFWYMIKAQAVRSAIPYGYGPDRMPTKSTRF